MAWNERLAAASLIRNNLASQDSVFLHRASVLAGKYKF